MPCLKRGNDGLAQCVASASRDVPQSAALRVGLRVTLFQIQLEANKHGKDRSCRAAGQRKSKYRAQSKKQIKAR
ncbi:protein of unknown function [Candidatus Filomicrobium marinum]|uniref:Uncharacterized protein n=1 Tax=Candidatus Filomicrobium marinum TaxID=1608628 RepID=A0A0D6JH71_9HYPH|nr:protein of unknown function [Candidatus Filomicrobium marinum]CPR20143.1 protein of unknown function [Candidatus Filomicrobium marinum]